MTVGAQGDRDAIEAIEAAGHKWESVGSLRLGRNSHGHRNSTKACSTPTVMATLTCVHPLMMNLPHPQRFFGAGRSPGQRH